MLRAREISTTATAVEKLHKKLLKLAGSDSPLHGAKLSDVEARDGGLFRRDDGRGETYIDLLRRAGANGLDVKAGSGIPMEMMQFSMASYGAQFCEVRVHEQTGEIRVSRWLGVFDCGRIINPKTTASQLRGGIIMGIGMALSEQTQFDERRGRIVNRSIAEYHVPVNLDVPDIQVMTTDHADPHSPLEHAAWARSGSPAPRPRSQTPCSTPPEIASASSQ